MNPNWYITGISYSDQLNHVIITTTTDRACHLWCRVTSIEPEKHIIPVNRRGAPVNSTIDQCFVAFTDIEQNEAGDTLTHTFNVPDWPPCETRYFYFWGYIALALCPSASPIYSHHNVGPPPISERCMAQGPYPGTIGSYRCYYYSSCFQPQVSYNITSCDITYGNHIYAATVCTDGRFELWTAAANGRPVLLLQTALFANPDITPGAIVTVNIPLTPTQLLAGSQYAIVWGWYDYYRVPRSKYSYWHRASGLNCEYTIPPARHCWIKRYDSGYRTRCLGLLQDWYTSGLDVNLRFKTYGSLI